MKGPLSMKRERASALWNGQMATFTTVSGLMVNKMEQVFLSMIVKKVIQLLMLGSGRMGKRYESWSKVRLNS